MVFNEHWTHFFWWSPASLIFTMSGFCVYGIFNQPKNMRFCGGGMYLMPAKRPTESSELLTYTLTLTKRENRRYFETSTTVLYNLFERRCIKKCSALLRLHVHTSCLIWQFDELFCCGHPNKQILKSTNNTFYWSVLLDFLKERTRFEKNLIWRTHLHWVNEKNK